MVQGKGGGLVCRVSRVSLIKRNRADRPPFSEKLDGQLCPALEQIRKMGKGGEGRRVILLSARRRATRCARHLIPLVLIVVAIETEQFPIAPIRRIVVVIMILVMDGELTEFLAFELSPAMRTDPWKHLERLFPIGFLQMSLGLPCHGSLGMKSNSV